MKEGKREDSGRKKVRRVEERKEVAGDSSESKQQFEKNKKNETRSNDFCGK